MIPQFMLLRKKIRGDDPIPKRLLALDPGETTGFAFFIEGELESWGQLNSKKDGPMTLMILMQELKPTQVVYENYRVYKNKTDMHTHNSLFTPKFIGAIETTCILLQVPFHKYMAVTVKGFVTDKKLKIWGYYIKGQQHARDAIRHGCYYILFYGRK